ncbi:hypothetical protein BOQ07_30840, partial [Klebsiella michiganensis]|uniref:hypothetical protein n=1 Tax=Klebsiella michiganensis TaxID=1134687 RepID=UPI00096434A4
FDDLTVLNNDIGANRTRYNSEYGQLAQGNSLSFTNFALVEAILPSSGEGVSSVNLVTKGDSVTVYALNNLVAPDQSSPEATFNSPVAAWQQISGPLTGSDAVKFMQGDKISFLLVASGNFSLSDIHVDYTGRDSKQVNNWQSQEKRARGSELLLQTRFGDTEIASWNRIGSVPRYVPAGGNPPAGCTKVVVVDDTNFVSQDFTAPTEQDAVELEIKIWCRRWIPLFSSTFDFSTSPITPDSQDFAELKLLIGQQADGKETLAMQYSLPVGLGWMEHKVRYWAVGGNAAATKALRLTLLGETGKQIEIAWVSAREV